jgi:hypothetical protein
MLVDPELARRARELLHEPQETNGKGNMSALGTHEITPGVAFGLEPPLNPPVVHGPSAMTTAGPVAQAHVDLPSPPPALRPPESSVPPQQPVQAAPIPAAPAAPIAPPQAPVAPVEPLMAPTPEPPAPAAPEVETVRLQPVAPAPAPAAEPALPAMAPEPAQPAPVDPVQPAALEPVQPVGPETGVQAHDYFATAEQAASQPLAAEPTINPEPAEAALPELQPVTIAPPAPAPEPVEAPAVAVEAAAQQLPSIAEAPAVPEQASVPQPMAPPPAEAAAVASTSGLFRVVVRLSDGDGVEVGQFGDFGTAMAGAQEVIEQFAHANGSWPFYAGRFIRPDLIISVDVVDGDAS